MRIVLVGTDLAPVRAGAGALETLLVGWADGLAADHDVHVLSVAGPADGAEADTDGPGRWERLTFERPAELGDLVDKLAPDAVVLDNRPSWQAHVRAPTLHLLHNWPDAWSTDGQADVGRLVGQAGLAAVSAELAATVAGATGRAAADVAVVTPWVGDELFAVRPSPEPGIVLCPNRLLIKKGIRELVAASGRAELAGRRVLVTDHLSPWSSPTPEHEALRAEVRAAARCELIAPPPDRASMAALYARAEVVVCPSIRPEGLGLSAVEAQAAGVPVVSSGLGGLASATLLPHLVADPRSPADLAAAIVAGSAVDAATRGALRGRIRARFSPEASLASLLAALERARPAAAR